MELVFYSAEHIWELDLCDDKDPKYSTTYRYVTYAAHSVISNVPLSCKQRLLLEQL